MFQTLKPRNQVEGSGMGLAIGAQAGRGLAGGIRRRCSSAEGKGSVVPLHLAERHDVLRRRHQWWSIPARPRRETRTVTLLLVDDDDGDATSGPARVHGVRRSPASDRAGGRRQRRARHPDGAANGKSEDRIPPYLLLVDLNMPRMNGIELVEALRADADLRQSVAFVLTTSKREDKVAAYDFNVAGYIVKATVGEDFQRLIDMMQCFWRVVELP